MKDQSQIHRKLGKQVSHASNFSPGWLSMHGSPRVAQYSVGKSQCHWVQGKSKKTDVCLKRMYDSKSTKMKTLKWPTLMTLEDGKYSQISLKLEVVDLERDRPQFQTNSLTM